MKANKCIVTGFPRTKNQGTLFESKFGEIQSIIEIVINEETLAQRTKPLLEKDPSITQRIDDYNNNVTPLLEYYKVFGKVRTVDGNLALLDAYKQFVEASLPEIFFIIGPKCGGKTLVCDYLKERTNIASINFELLSKQKHLISVAENPEKITKELIKEIHKIKADKLIIEGFPVNSRQLLYFLSNAAKPTKCLFLHTPENSCITFSQKSDKTQVSSATLCKIIKDFYISTKDVFPILKQNNFLVEITNNDETPVETLFEKISVEFDPELILMRRDEDSEEAMNDAIKSLTEKLCYRLINVPELCKEEVVRKTKIGLELIDQTIAGKFITTEMLLKCLRKYLYSLDRHKKFLLINFPDEIAQLRLLEKACCHVAKDFYFYPEQGEILVKTELCTIETLMKKTNRLIPITMFNPDLLERYYGDNLTYAVILGAPLSGKTAVAKRIEKSGYTLLDGNVLTEDIKKKLATEDNPAENITVTLEQLLDEIKLKITTRENKREKFVLDGLPIEDASAITKLIELVGPPAFFVELTCNNNELKERYKKKNEVQELGEDQVAEIDKGISTHETILKSLEPIKSLEFVQAVEINTDGSEEQTSQYVRGIFEANLMLITNEESIEVATILQNLSIKYNFLYISLADIIQAEINADTEIGRELKRTRKFRSTIDESPNWEFFPIHYEFKLLLQLTKDTIKKLRVAQKHVLVNGLINVTKLKDTEDRIELRAMDELLTIEKEIGDIKAIVRLTKEDYEDVLDDRVAEKIVIEEKKEEKKEEKEEKKEDAEGEPEEPSAPVEGEEGSDKPKFKPELFAWTNTEGKPRNMGQFFTAWKKCASKNILYNPLQSNGFNTEIVMDSLLASLLSGQLSKKTVYVQVRFSL